MAIVSKGNNKLGKIPNVSLPPIITCGDCTERCGKTCYAQKFYKMWPSVKKAWDANLYHYKTNYYGYFNEIKEQFSKIRNKKFFRWHTSGDIVSIHYLKGMVLIAEFFPETKFLCFTKNYKVVNDYVYIDGALPSNLKMIFSAWPGLEMDNPYRFPVAYMQDGTETRVPDDAFHCGGSCMTCSYCFEVEGDVVFEAH